MRSLTDLFQSNQVFFYFQNILFSRALSQFSSKILQVLVKLLELFRDIELLVPLAHESSQKCSGRFAVSQRYILLLLFLGLSSQVRFIVFLIYDVFSSNFVHHISCDECVEVLQLV